MQPLPLFVCVFAVMNSFNALADATINGNCNAIGNGNSVCNLYINQKLKFDEQTAKKLLSLLPSKKPIRLIAIGSPSEQRVAMEYTRYLSESGYSFIPGVSIGMTNMMPEQQITVQEFPDHYDLTIAAGVF